MAGLSFLRKQRWFPSAADFEARVGRPGEVFEALDRQRSHGHSFQQVGYAINGDRWFAWTYPGLVGPPPVVRLGDGFQHVVAGSVESLVWTLLDEEPEDSHELARWRRLRAKAEAELGPRPAPDDRVHPDFAVLLAEPGAIGPIGTFVRTWATVPEQADERLVAGDLDGAVAILDGGGAAEWVARGTALLLQAGRVEDAWARLPQTAERLLAEHDTTFEGLPNDQVDPMRLAADRLVAPWRKGLQTILEARASPQGRRDRLARLAATYRKCPVGLLAIAVAEAGTRAEEGDADGTRAALEAIRRSPLAGDVADQLAAVERRTTPKKRKPKAPPTVNETPPDLPLVEELAHRRRRSVDRTAEALRAALQELAGPNATCTWDGKRFRLAGTEATVDSLLDAAVERIR